MKSSKTKIFPLVVVFAAIVFILFGVAVYQVQLKTWFTYPPLSADSLERLFGNSSCSWPCWQGIIPGITTSTEALQKLGDSPLVMKDSIQPDGSETGNGNANWLWKIDNIRPEDPGEMEWRYGIVYEIQLLASHNVSIGEAINKFGPPKKVNVFDCTEIPEMPQYWCAILYYTENGFLIRMSWEGSRTENSLKIAPSDTIEYIVLFEPVTLEKWLASRSMSHLYPDLQDWKGYGDLYDSYIQ